MTIIASAYYFYDYMTRYADTGFEAGSNYDLILLMIYHFIVIGEAFRGRRGGCGGPLDNHGFNSLDGLWFTDESSDETFNIGSIFSFGDFKRGQIKRFQDEEEDEYEDEIVDPVAYVRNMMLGYFFGAILQTYLAVVDWQSFRSHWTAENYAISGTYLG